MTQDMMTLRALLEKSSDADLLREMIGFTAERLMALEVEGLTGAARRRALGGSYHPPQRLPRPVLGDPGRHGRVEDPEAEEGELLPRLPGAAADGREGACCGDPGAPHIQVRWATDGCQRRSKSTPLAGVKMHHLMRFSPALAVVPVVHRRDPRCFV